MENVRILIVEDDVSSAIILQKILLKANYEIVSVVNNGQDAVSEVEAKKPDIILMDISITGGMDGVETASIIKESHEIPVIYLTGYSDEATIDRAKKTAPFAYILKPFREKEVTITIQMAIYKSSLDLQVKESENRLATTLGSLHDGVISTDVDHRITYLNPAAELITGSIFERVAGEPVSSILTFRNLRTRDPIEEVDGFVFSDLRAVDRNSAVALISASEEERVVLCGSSQTLGQRDEPNGHVIVLRDITDHYKAEQMNRLMAAALENLHDAVIITDPYLSTKHSPEVISVNRAFEKITGFTAAEVVGKPLNFLRGDRTDLTIVDMVKRSIQAGHAFEGENVQYTKDRREFTAHWTVNAVRDGEDEISQLVFVLRDISKLRDLEDNIRQSQKIEAIGRLAGGIAHDFNNLLSVINSYSELLSLKLPAEDNLHKYVDNIRTAGKRGAGLVSQLMTFSRREATSPVLLDLAEITTETESMLRPIIREDIDLQTELATNLLPVKADPGQIEQILVNMCVNARDAMPDGGGIKLSLRNVRIERGGKSDATAESEEYMIPGQYVLLTVEDNGTGMDEHVKKHLFEPFFTTKDVGKGTGLGLATVYGIVKQCGGYIHVDSELGKGTRFFIHFPAVVEEKSVSSSIQHEKITHIPRGSETILLVEDDETFADCISGLLSLHGYIVYSAGDGSEAIERFAAKAPDIKLLITDIVLPKASGREVATRFLEANPDIKIIFMTGYDDELDSFYSFPAECVMMQKPFSLNTILNKVRDLLDATTPG